MEGDRITMELLRKSAEHNEGEISTLEELSLHQRNLFKIELLDTACRDLKILLLQNNLIAKIENIKRLKLLDYLNLALNNIKVVEGLGTCEMLRKLDLTVNFIADLTSIKSLIPCRNLKELYLTGNPCSQYDGYREFVIATLPQLEQLDGIRITRSDRILALQNIEALNKKIVSQSQRAVRKEEERLEKLARRKARAAEGGGDGPGSDWYCNPKSKGSFEPKIVELNSDHESSDSSDPEIDPEEEKRYWEQEDEFTPESRTEAAMHAKRVQEIEERKKAGIKKKKKVKRNFFKADGRAYNMNDAGLDFVLEGQFDEYSPLVLDLAIYKYLETSSIDLDVQPKHIRVTFKNKVFQLALPDEVKPDSSNAERSKVTGHLVVTMPKLDQKVKPIKIEKPKAEPEPIKREKLEVEPAQKIDYSKIIEEAAAQKAAKRATRKTQTRPNDDDFIDDDDVPPLE